jgi:hypothetical protein
MRYATLTLVMLSLVSAIGCMGSSSSSVKWSENIALYAESRDSKLNDANINSVGETSPFISDVKNQKSEEEADKYSQALLEWKKPQKVQRVIVKANPGDLEFFAIQYQDDQENWQTLQSVQNNVKEEYKFELKQPVTTYKLRLKVPRQWESRQKGGEKRRQKKEGGGPAGSFKKIREFEVYYALPPETTPAVQPTTTQ